MTEAFRTSPPIFELQLPSENLMLEQGVYDYRQALIYATTSSSETLNAIKTVAESMTDSGISPLAALYAAEGFTSEDLRYIDHKNVVRADIYAMLGEDDKMREALKEGKIPKEWRLSPYLFAIKTRVRNGIDPTEMVEEAMSVISQIPDKDGPYGDENDFRASEYLSIARQLIELGQDETAPLIKAWEEMDTTYGEDFYNAEDEIGKIIHVYSEMGNYKKATEMFNRIKRDRLSSAYYESMKEVMHSYVNAGEFDEALNFARSHKIGYIIPVVLAKKAIYDAEQGIDVTRDVVKIAEMESVVVDEDRFEKIYPLLGIALAKSGARQQAGEVFAMIEDAIQSDHINFLETPEVYLALANAVHDAGMDSDEIFTRLWSYYEKWANDEDVVGLSEVSPILGFVYGNLVTSTIVRGKLEHARKAIDAEGNIGWWKALHMAELAKREIMVARDSIAA